RTAVSRCVKKSESIHAVDAVKLPSPGELSELHPTVAVPAHPQLPEIPARTRKMRLYCLKSTVESTARMAASRIEPVSAQVYFASRVDHPRTPPAAVVAP